MIFSEFILLTEAEKARTVQSGGVYSAGREDCDNYILLYQSESFYVELYYPKKGYGPDKTKSFKYTERLRPYLEQMDISEVLKILA